MFILSTVDYKGFILFTFQNGKIAKITLDSYLTKLNRKKQINAYSDKSPLFSAIHITDESDIFAIRTDNQVSDRAILLNTSLIPSYSTKNSAGVQVITLGKKGVLDSLVLLEGEEVEGKEEYRVSKVPSSGKVCNNIMLY